MSRAHPTDGDAPGGRLARLKQSAAFVLLSESISAWSANNTLRLGAALAYYAVFSFGPLLIIVVAIAGFAFGHEAARGELFNQLRQLAGDDAAAALQTLLASTQNRSSNILASLVGAATLMIGASAVFSELKDALNLIWRVPAATTARGWAMLRSRLLSFAMVLALGFLLFASVVSSAAIAAAGKHFGAVQPIPLAVLHVLLFVGSLLVIALLFAFIFKTLPDTPIRWSDVWLGAGVTSLLFTIGKGAIGIYLGRTSTASAYGAAGSVVVIMVWTYYSAQILFFGAELSEVYSRRYGSRQALAAAPRESSQKAS